MGRCDSLLPRPPTELADGFGRGRRPTARDRIRDAAGRFTPEKPGSPAPLPIVTISARPATDSAGAALTGPGGRCARRDTRPNLATLSCGIKQTRRPDRP